jgi:hypothetical protein
MADAGNSGERKLFQGKEIIIGLLLCAMSCVAEVTKPLPEVKPMPKVRNCTPS